MVFFIFIVIFGVYFDTFFLPFDYLIIISYTDRDNSSSGRSVQDLLSETAGQRPAASKPRSNPFGDAKPRDEAKIMREIEEKRAAAEPKAAAAEAKADAPKDEAK